MKKFNELNKMLKVAIIAAFAVVVFAIIAVILAITKVFDVNPLKLCALVLTLGLALVFMVYGLAVKGGYETAVGILLAIVGVTILLIPVIKFWVILIDVLLLVLALLALMLLKSDNLLVKRAEDDPNYKTYEQVKAEKEAKRAEEESKPLPELKNYNKEDKSI